jgi:hypothetical protein
MACGPPPPRGKPPQTPLRITRFVLWASPPSPNAIGSFRFNERTQARNATYQACETCVVYNWIGLVKMDLMATSEVYDHEESAPAVAEIPEPQQPAENDNKFQKAIAVWRGTLLVLVLCMNACAE